MRFSEKFLIIFYKNKNLVFPLNQLNHLIEFTYIFFPDSLLPYLNYNNLFNYVKFTRVDRSCAFGDVKNGKRDLWHI